MRRFLLGGTARIVAIVALLSSFTMFASAADETFSRPNIVYIMADDHTSQAWGCYGSRLAEYCPTPNIDRLATEGVRLDNCFCTNSICVPSRAAILTGQYSHVNGVKTLAGSLSPKADNVAKHLQQCGYEIALVGKWHLKNEPAGFDYWNIIKGQGRYHEPVMFEMDLTRPEKQVGGYCTDVFTDKALNWLNHRESTKPFCLMLHFKATHEPWNFHKRYASLYEDIDLPEPETLFGSTGPAGTRVPGWPLEILTQRMIKGGHGAGKLVLNTDDPVEIRKETYQKFIKAYLRCVAGIDENIGRVLALLDEKGIADDTLVVYTSDQGYFLGEHNYFDKRFMLEESLRMPLVARYPREIKPGTVLDDIILNVDFAPTFLDYARAEVPSSMQGRSFRANLAGSTPADWRQETYYRYYGGQKERPAHFGIRTHNEKLIYYDGLTNVAEDGRWEFYDLAIDPKEKTNVYDDLQYAQRIAELKQRLQKLQTNLGDQP